MVLGLVLEINRLVTAAAAKQAVEPVAEVPEQSDNADIATAVGLAAGNGQTRSEPAARIA
jgi:hypothetical protein